MFSKHLHNGTAAEMTYDAAGRQTQLTNRGASSAVPDAHAYAFDTVGRRVSVLDDAGRGGSDIHDVGVAERQEGAP